jgi:hypothetical protein
MVCPVAKLHSINYTAGREVGLVKTLKGNGAVTGFREVLQDGFTGIGPDFCVRNDDQPNDDDSDYR